MHFTAAFLSLAELASTNSGMAHVDHPAKLNYNCIWEWFPGKKRNCVDSLLEFVERSCSQVLWCGNASVLKFWRKIWMNTVLSAE